MNRPADRGLCLLHFGLSRKWVRADTSRVGLAKQLLPVDWIELKFFFCCCIRSFFVFSFILSVFGMMRVVWFNSFDPSDVWFLLLWGNKQRRGNMIIYERQSLYCYYFYRSQHGQCCCGSSRPSSNKQGERIEEERCILNTNREREREAHEIYRIGLLIWLLPYYLLFTTCCRAMQPRRRRLSLSISPLFDDCYRELDGPARYLYICICSAWFTIHVIYIQQPTELWLFYMAIVRHL